MRKKIISLKAVFVLTLISSSFFISGKNCLAQSFELAGTYSNSDAGFYKNTPGISVAYSWHFKKQFVFVELTTLKKEDNSFTEFNHLIYDTYRIKTTTGSFSTSSVNVGVAQKLLTSNCLEFSVGAEAGLNYYKQDNEFKTIELNNDVNEVIYYDNGNEIEKRKNKVGFGAFIDMELKEIIFKNISIFSRINIYHSDYIDGPIEYGGPPKTRKINSLSYRIGLRYRIQSVKE